MRKPFTGVGTALVTPFRKDGSLDEAAVKRLARRQIDARLVVPARTVNPSVDNVKRRFRTKGRRWPRRSVAVQN